MKKIRLLNFGYGAILGVVFFLGCSIKTEPLPALNFVGKKWHDVHRGILRSQQIELKTRPLISDKDRVVLKRRWKAPPLEFKLQSCNENDYLWIPLCEYTIPYGLTTYSRCWLVLVNPDGIIIAQKTQFWGDISPPKMPHVVFARFLEKLSVKDLSEISKFNYSNEPIIHIEDKCWLLTTWPIDINYKYDKTAENIFLQALRE